jgi:hypothetical protein
MSIDSSTMELYGRPVFTIDGTDDDLLFEQVIDFSGGEDDYRRSTLIGQNQCQKLVNIIVRDNYEAWTRPGADLFAANLGQTPIQTLTYFDTPTGKYVLAICNGALKACPGQGQPWQNPVGTYTPANAPVEMAQGIDTVLISDGLNALAILDANLNLTTCATGVNDPPVGASILCWHTGRMFAAGFSGIAGAAVPRDTVAVSNLLSFGNGQWNLTSRSFRVGNGNGEAVIGMESLHDAYLAVFMSNSIFILNTPASQDLTGFTKNTDVESLSLGVGLVGKRAKCSVANDIFFMAQDGVRSLQRMQAAAGQWQLSAPLSQPVQQYINRINQAVRQNIVATAYQEFVFFAIPLDSSAVNNATLVYNTRLNAWLGCWTGWTPAAWAKSRFNSIEQLLFGDSAGNLNFWKDTADTNNPSTYLDNGANVPCTIWTRSFQFLQAVNNKTAHNCVLRFTAGNSTANLSAVMDLAQSIAWSQNFAAQGDILGQGRLGPFQLASVKPVKVMKSLRSLPSFNEMYLVISTNSGFLKLRSVTLAAFLNALEG